MLLLGCISCSEKKISFEERVADCEARYSEQLKNKENSMTIYQDNLQCIVGAEIPLFENRTTEGLTIDYNYFKGKVNVINFWFANCKPCIAEMPGLNAIVEKYAGKDVNFLAISTDDKSEVLRFLDSQAFNFDHISNGRALMRDTFKSKSGFPYTLVVDKKNIIRYVLSGGRIDSTASQVIQDKLIPVIEAHL